MEALPRVIQLMSEELGWDKKRQEAEFKNGVEFLASMGLQPARLNQLVPCRWHRYQDVKGKGIGRLAQHPLHGQASLKEADAQATTCRAPNSPARR